MLKEKNPKRVPKIANTLRRLREDAFLSQRELAIKAGVSPSTVYLLEQGSEAQFRTVRKLAAALEIHPRDLVDKEE